MWLFYLLTDNEKNQRNDLKIYSERKKEMACLVPPQHKTMDYEDKEWPVEHFGERDKEKLTVGETRHQKKKKVCEMRHQKTRNMLKKKKKIKGERERERERERGKISFHFNVFFFFFFFCLPCFYCTQNTSKEFFFAHIITRKILDEFSPSWSGRPGFNPTSYHTKDFKNGTWYLLA